MENIDKRLQQFEPKLKIVFFKMIMGINVQITNEFREYWGKDNLGKWFFIQAINSDESVTLCSQTHQIFDNVPLKHLIV